MASDTTRYTNKVFMTGALPLLKTIANDVPELKKKFEGVNAVYQVSAMANAQDKEAIHFIIEDGEWTVKLGEYLGQQKIDAELQFASMEKMNAFFKGNMSALPKTNYIKSIVTSECKMDMERKGVQSYQRDIYARFLCFGNGALTSLYDHSDGFFRRQLILTTKDKPADRTDDPFLVEKMCAELEGILLWCLEGLHRLVQNDFRFTVSERAAANVDTIKRSSNNVIDFMESEGYFRFKADYSISSKEFYDIYKQWCEDNACHSVSAIRFSAELRQNDRRYNLEATNNIYLPGGRRVRGFVGIEPLVHPCP